MVKPPEGGFSLKRRRGEWIFRFVNSSINGILNLQFYVDSILLVSFMAKELSNDDFALLMKVKKCIEGVFIPPVAGEKRSYELSSSSKKDKFILDLNRGGRIELGRKKKFQNRYYEEVLVRLEIDSLPHINPDGKKLSGNHIHVYSEEYGDKYAYELDEFGGADFSECSTFEDYLDVFCVFCNITIAHSQITMP